MSLGHNTSIVTDGLVYYLDFANRKCWDGTSTNFTSLIGTGTATLSNGQYFYDTTSYSAPVMTLNNNINLTTATSTGTVLLTTPDLDALAQNYSMTVMFAARKMFYGQGGNNNGTTELMNGVHNGYTTGWRLSDGNQSPIQPIPYGIAFTGTHFWSLGINELGGNYVSVGDSGSTNRMNIVAFSIDPSNLTGFCNGSTSQRTNLRNYLPNTNKLTRISYTSAGAGSFNGHIGFLMIYNRALTDNEINQNYNAMRGRYGL